MSGGGIDHVVFATEAVLVASGKESGAAGGADGGGDVGLSVVGAFVGDAVDIGGLDLERAGGGEVSVAEVVGHDDDEVGFCLRGGLVDEEEGGEHRSLVRSLSLSRRGEDKVLITNRRWRDSH